MSSLGERSTFTGEQAGEPYFTFLFFYLLILYLLFLLKVSNLPECWGVIKIRFYLINCSGVSTLSTSEMCLRTPIRVRNASSLSWNGELDVNGAPNYIYLESENLEYLEFKHCLQEYLDWEYHGWVVVGPVAAILSLIWWWIPPSWWLIDPPQNQPNMPRRCIQSSGEFCRFFFCNMRICHL